MLVTDYATKTPATSNPSEKEAKEVPHEGPVGVELLANFSDDQLGWFCQRDDVLGAQLKSIEKKNMDPYSREQQDIVLSVYDGCLHQLHGVYDFAQWEEMDDRRKEVAGKGARATVALLKRTGEFAMVKYEDVQRWVNNRKRRKTDKLKTGIKVDSVFESDVLDKLLIVVLEVRIVVINTLEKYSLELLCLQDAANVAV